MNFSDKYRKDNEMITAPEDGLEKIEANENTAPTIRWSKIAIVAACMLLAVAILLPTGGYLLNRYGSGQPAQPPAASTGGVVLSTAQTYDDVYASISTLYGNASSDGGMREPTDGMIEENASVSTATSDASADSAAGAPTKYDSQDSDYSGTNTQVAGVDEGDIIKTDGEYIYRLRDDGSIAIVRASDLSLMSETDTLTEGYGYCYELYLSNDRIAVLYSYSNFDAAYAKATAENGGEIPEDFYFDEPYEDYCGTLVYDITNRSEPKRISSTSQSGYYSASRMIDGMIYLVTSYYIYSEPDESHPETYVPILYNDSVRSTIPAGDISIPEQVASAQYTVVTSIDITDGTQFCSTKAVLGAAGTVYSDADSLLVASSSWSEASVESVVDGKNVTTVTDISETTLVLFALDGGRIEQTASGAIPGILLNQFSIDEYNGVYRIVTTEDTSVATIYTDGIDTYEYEYRTVNGLYTLDGALKLLGKVDSLAEDERVYSVRFDGDIGYFVTFRQVDPLFAVDLSDPASPTVLSALKIPGFSEYLHKFDDGLLFGLGYNADEETGMTTGIKMTMFDVSDPTDVSELTSYTLDIDYSEALSNHKAILVSKERNIIAFPSSTGYEVYGYSDTKGFFKRADVDFSDGWVWGMRGLYINDRFYVCSTDRICMYDISDFSLISTLNFFS